MDKNMDKMALTNILEFLTQNPKHFELYSYHKQ